MKQTSFLIATLLFLLVSSTAEALNNTSLLLLDRLFEQGRKATHEELLEILIPVASDETLTHMKKKREMSYLIYISGWKKVSKSEKNNIYFEVYRAVEERRRMRYLKTHPDLDAEIREAISKGRALVGMSEESVKASLGKPEEVKPAIGTFMNTERWYYFTKRKVLFFKDGRVSSLKTR